MVNFRFLRLPALTMAVAAFCAGLPTQSPASEIDPRLGAPLTKRLRVTEGPEEAPLIVIEVRSFKCPHCRAFHEKVFPTLRTRYITSEQVHWVSINATPDPADANGAVFALARCALQLGSYREMEPFLFQNGMRASSFLYSRAATLPGIDTDHFNACVRNGGALNEVRADFAEVAALKVTSLPTFILRKRRPDGSFVETRIEGYPQADQFDAVMRQLREHP